jgi:hypothetical protein
VRDLIKFVKTQYNVPLTIAEIGVERGVNATEILQGLNVQRLYLVDHYLPYGDCLTNGGCPQEVQDKVYRNMFMNLQNYLDRITLVTKDSVFASSLFPDEFFDFVYIDASHDYEPVRQDILAWWPKIKVGGIIGGHDYKNSPYVEQAVKDFAADKQLIELLEDTRHAEWGIIK